MVHITDTRTQKVVSYTSEKTYQMNFLITAIHVSCFSDKGLR